MRVAREVVVGAGRGAVVAGGLVEGDQSTARAYRLSLSHGDVTPLPDLAVPVHDAAGARLGGAPAVIGGGGATEQATVQALGRLGGGPASRWRIVGQLPTPRADLVTATVGRQSLVIGGYDGRATSASVLGTTDGRHFEALGRLAVGVRYPAAVVAGGAVWLFGGERDGQLLDVVQRLDPLTGRTGVVAHLPRPLGHGSALMVGDRILLVGGRTAPDAVTAEMWWFDPADLTFRRAGRLPYALADTGVLVTPEGGYLLGGETPALTRRVIRLVVH